MDVEKLGSEIFSLIEEMRYSLEELTFNPNAQLKMKTSAEKWSEAVTEAIASEDLLAAKMRELIARLSLPV